MHKLMCIVMFVVIAFYQAIRRICLHDVYLMHMCAESACGAEEGVLGYYTQSCYQSVQSVQRAPD